MLAGDTGWMISHPSGLVQELYCKMKSQQLRPRVLVSYVREPYVYKLKLIFLLLFLFQFRNILPTTLV